MSVPPTPPSLRRGSELRVQVEKFADRGKSLVHVGGLVVFIPGAVPGDEVDIRIRRVKRRFAEAEITSLVRPSEFRTTPACNYFGSCGGCKWQHVDYSAQRDAKRQSVQEAFEHTGGLADVEVPVVIEAERKYFYRNKMEFSFSAQRWLTGEEIRSGQPFDKSFALGLHAPGQFAKVIDIQECHLQSEESARIVNLVRSLAKRHSWSPWNTRSGSGLLRHLVIRESRRTDDRMVNLVLSAWDQAVIDQVAEALAASPEAVTTFVCTINDTPAQTALGDRVQTVFGDGYIHERIDRFEFRIGPQSFFQTNTDQAERLYTVVRELAEFGEEDLVYDLYCGTGTIAIVVSDHVRRVVGIESVDEAVLDARRNALANEVSNCEFFAGDVLRLLDDSFVKHHGRPDVVIVDPPRAGLHPRVVERIATLRSPRFVYVSCNPQTQARDLRMMDRVYNLDRMQPVDLFPHTDHVENVARLSLID